MKSKIFGASHLLATVLFGFGLFQNASALQISLTSNTNFFVDFSSAMSCDHVSFSITNNDGVTYSNLWMTLGSFTNTSMRLGGGDPGRYPLGVMTNICTKPAFFYLEATNDPTTTPYNNQFTLKIYNGFPTTGTLLVSSNFTVTVQTTSANNANKVNSVTYSPTNNPVVGGTFEVRVFGNTGNVGSGNPLVFTGAAFTNWNAGAFQMVACNIVVTDSPSYVLVNTLATASAAHITGTGDAYEADYWFRAIATTSTNTPVSPVSFLQNGGSVLNHCPQSSLLVLPTVLPATNLTTLSSLVASTQLYTNQTVTFTIRVTNASVFDVTLDRFADTLPGGFTYIANSSTFNGATVLEPTNVSQVLTWSQGYTVPAGTSRDFVFNASPTGYTVNTSTTNSCIAYVQNAQIDTTLNTSDNAPAKETVIVLVAPIAGNVSTNTLENHTLTVAAPGVLANTIEPNGFPVTVVTNTQPAHGTVTVSTNGSYIYTPTAFYSGSDSFTFTITNQNGRTSIGTNTITVNFVNQPPTINSISNLNLVENWSLRTVNFNGVTVGPTNETGQTLTVTATSSNPSLIPNPTVNYTSANTNGTLTFTPATNSFGSATITVVVHDSGGTANGGIDSVTNTFVVTETGITNYWIGGSNLVVNIFNATGSAGSGYSQTNYTGVLSVVSSNSNPFTIKPTGLASNFNSASNYTWTIATTTRGVIGFATNKIVFDTSAFTNDMAGGYFTVTLSGDGSSVVLNFTGNNPPTSSPATYTRAFNTALRIPIGNLLSNYTADPDGDARVLARVGASTNGTYISTNSLYILFAPSNNVTESFTYTIRDARTYRPGDTVYYSTNWITIQAIATVGYANSISSIGGGAIKVKFAGIPNYAYDVERASNVSGPWTVVLTTNAPYNGIWTYVDSSPPLPMAFYRTKQH